MISATSAISKSYLVLKSMNMKHTIQEKVGSTCLEAVFEWVTLKDNFFVYKSCLKHAKNKISDNFCDWMQKSKLLVLCLKAVFGCPKPAFGHTKPVKTSFCHFCAAFVSQKSGFVHLKDSFVYKIKNLIFGIQLQNLSKSWFWTRFRRLLYEDDF